MGSYMMHHNDGTVRMDWYTFCALKTDAIVKTIQANRMVKPKHTIRPLSRKRGVKQFS